MSLRSHIKGGIDLQPEYGLFNTIGPPVFALDLIGGHQGEERLKICEDLLRSSLIKGIQNK
jgi:hypothetical protein